MANADGLRERLREKARYVLEVGTDRTMQRMRDHAPKGQTGDLARLIEATEDAAGPDIYRRTIRATAEHASFVSGGTGLYGPRAALIFPTRAKVLRFETAGGDVVFARSVRGQRPNPFWTDGVAAWPDELRAASASLN